MFFSVLLVSFSLFRPGVVRAPLDKLNSSRINLIYIALINIAANSFTKPLAGP